MSRSRGGGVACRARLAGVAATTRVLRDELDARRGRPSDPRAEPYASAPSPARSLNGTQRARGYALPRHRLVQPPLHVELAVAEVYDTLTAPDTYRTPMTSFEALTELRRVAGKQLDADYVEALAELLAGRGVEYRHADEADFDRELDIERRMNEAVAPST